MRPLLRSPLLHFLAAGILLIAIQSAWSRTPSRPVVEVSASEIDSRVDAYARQMGRDATAEETQAIESQVVEDAIWLDQAFALGLVEIDPVVRQRLLLNMRFLVGSDDEPEATGQAAPMNEDALVARAIELGMDRSDTVVQRRLVDRVQAIVRANVRARGVSDEALAAYYVESAADWREPALLDFQHVYLSRDKRGEAAESDAGELREKLEADPLTPEAATRLGDPFLAGHRLRGATPSRIVARLGPDFEAGIANAPVGRWTGPIPSAFGSHLVWIEERTPSAIPPLEKIETRVREQWFERESRKALRAHVDRLRTKLEIRIVEDGGVGDARG